MLLAAAHPALAHQPFFEDQDFTAAAPGRVKDPTVSTALYATLESRSDVDYVTFEGRRGQKILIGITIPAIAGQEEFAPTVALLGPGLPDGELPAQVARPLVGGAAAGSAGSERGASGEQEGAIVWPAPAGEAPVFFEPFSSTSYWERQEDRVELPEDGQYTVAVWSDRGALGRYTLVVGDREVFGGDPAFGVKLGTYWTAVPQPSEPEQDTEQGVEPSQATPAPGGSAPVHAGCGRR
jgi:hypothetical protein